MKVVRMIGQTAVGFLLTICLLVLIGAAFYGFPLLSPIGSVVLSVFGPWVLVLPVAIGIFESWMWRRARSRSALVIVGVAVLTAGWATAVLANITAEFRQHGVPLDLAETLRVRILAPAQPDGDVEYDTWQQESLHVVVYKPQVTTPAAAAPTLLYIHGGGFTQGDRFEGGTNLRWFADRGWLVLSIDYSLSSDDRHLWDIPTRQVGCAMVWAASNAARFGGDPARLSLTGSSAGGNLAINAGYLANAGQLESSCGGKVPRVSTVSALYPPVDLAAAWASRVPFISDMARKFNTAYIGGSPEQYPERYRFVGSVGHIHAAAPPTLVIFGANDHLVPPDATDRFVALARKAGIRVTSVRFPFGEHAFNLNQFGFGNQFYLGMTDKFLRQNGQQPAVSAE